MNRAALVVELLALAPRPTSQRSATHERICFGPVFSGSSRAIRTWPRSCGIRMGAIAPEEARGSPMKSVLTQAVVLPGIGGALPSPSTGERVSVTFEILETFEPPPRARREARMAGSLAKAGH
jgi:hypothetical protein